MNEIHNLSCPICNNNNFILKYEAKYVYSYAIDSNAPGINNNDKFFSFLYDTRNQKESIQYIECNQCGTKYSCYFDNLDKGINPAALSSVINPNNILK